MWSSFIEGIKFGFILLGALVAFCVIIGMLMLPFLLSYYSWWFMLLYIIWLPLLTGIGTIIGERQGR